jgi:hypothetical protein
MGAFSSFVTATFATMTAAAVTPVRNSLPGGVSYSEPGLIFCLSDNCEGPYDPQGVGTPDMDCNFLPYNLAIPGGNCEFTWRSRSFISYVPENVTSLPYDVRCGYMRLVVVLN